MLEISPARHERASPRHPVDVHIVGFNVGMGQNGQLVQLFLNTRMHLQTHLTIDNTLLLGGNSKKRLHFLLCIMCKLTPFKTTSWLSLHFMKRTIFQLVVQFTEFTC